MYGSRKKFYLRSIPEVRDRVISCSSFSKEFAMTGWRVAGSGRRRGHQPDAEGAGLLRHLRAHDLQVASWSPWRAATSPPWTWWRRCGSGAS